MQNDRFVRFFTMTVSMLLLWTVPAHPAHPLITDDTFTQGKGNTQIEISYKYAQDDDNGVKTRTSQPQIQVSYGILDPLDVIVTVPYLFVKTEQTGNASSVDGIGDVTTAVKWRFFGDKEGFQFAIKPSMTFPTGNEEKGRESVNPPLAPRITTSSTGSRTVSRSSAPMTRRTGASAPTRFTSTTTTGSNPTRMPIRATSGRQASPASTGPSRRSGSSARRGCCATPIKRPTPHPHTSMQG